MPCLKQMYGSPRIVVNGARKDLDQVVALLYQSPSKMKTGLKKVVPLGIPLNK